MDSNSTCQMKVTPKEGEPYVYLVDSQRPGMEPYTVDLLELNRNGACTCTDFWTRCLKNYRENGKRMVPYGSRDNKNPKRSQCFHIALARWHWANKTLKEEADKLR
jgi:hypothetical protein